MSQTPEIVVRRPNESVLATNSVIKNTYMLLSMTLLFSAFTAWISMKINMPHMGILVTLGGYFGLLFLTTKLRNSAWGILSIFALTGFMGLTLGPVINMYLQAFSNGAELVAMAMGGTGTIFIGLSAYALTTKKDFSFMGGFLMVGILAAFLLGIGALIFSIPALSLAVSGLFIMLMSGLILYQTSEIIHGGETNYIMATITLYITIYNLFMSLLHILGAVAGDD
ncbi:MAG: BAX inhibitor (BI)-1/YccA family protein [Gammaproteobacteria bacterium]|nr:MAG: BAX inhibitor (BI)-1/YccA family protein [Gammaproteobacteria bacterium]RKZ70680.1 MAG: BAX inhibitor (BI)-1/YccA family protein [Gammaproteobacteria bacterium]